MSNDVERGSLVTHGPAPLSATPGAMRVAGVEGSLPLPDGRGVCFRAIRPDDGPQLVAFHAGLSPETLVRRYLYRVGALSAEQAAQIAQVDYHDRMALLATTGPEPEAAIVGVAEYGRVDAGAADIGLVVSDGWQRRGIGTALFARLATYARARGVATFVALTQTSNTRVLAMARRSGYPCTAEAAALEIELRLDISAAPRVL